jgi:hypothetical protein
VARDQRWSQSWPVTARLSNNPSSQLSLARVRSLIIASLAHARDSGFFARTPVSESWDGDLIIFDGATADSAPATGPRQPAPPGL